MRRAVLVAGALFTAWPALADGSFYGRWARDQAACSADGVMAPLAITGLALQWPDTVCAVRRSYRVGNSWHIGAHCPDAASDVPVTLQLDRDRLRVLWGGATAEFRRCP
jgi:hypothetical protein